jgi:hypothetical protein
MHAMHACDSAFDQTLSSIEKLYRALSQDPPSYLVPTVGYTNQTFGTMTQTPIYNLWRESLTEKRCWPTFLRA